MKCEAVANTSASAKRGNGVLFAAVEVLFKIPPLFNMAVKQVSHLSDDMYGVYSVQERSSCICCEQSRGGVAQITS